MHTLYFEGIDYTIRSNGMGDSVLELDKKRIIDKTSTLSYKISV